MNQCHFRGRCQDPRCPSNETHLPDCNGLDYGILWYGVVWCLMCPEEAEAWAMRWLQ